MVKPAMPEWDTNETNITEADISRKEDGWLESAGVPEKPPFQYFNWWQNLVYKWIVYLELILGGNRLVIDTQAKYDAYFDGAGIKTGNIYLASGVAYQLNNNVLFGSNFKLDGDPGVTIERAGLYNFISSGTVGVRLSGVYFSPNLTFDGKKATYTITTNGGFADITYCDNSIFEINVVDCKTSVLGGAYHATINTTLNNIIKNITGCEGVNSGGVYGAYYSKISNVTGCDGFAVVDCRYSEINRIYDNLNGGVDGCHNSDITFISGHTPGNGIGVLDCENCSRISNIYSNVVGVTGCIKSKISNVYGNSADGVSNSHQSTITNIYGNGTGFGGAGVFNCDDCTIDNINNNGYGGVYECNESTISNIYDNTGEGALAGGCWDCNNSVFLGTFRGNTGTGAYNHIQACLTGIAFAIGDGTTSIKISAARETINL